MKRENDSTETLHPDSGQDEAIRDARWNWLKPSSGISTKQKIIISTVIFLIAFSCRFLSWQDNRIEARKVQSAVTDGYKHTANLLREGGARSFFSSESELSNPIHIGHPPGYPILIATLFSAFGTADTSLQFIQIFADSIAAVIIFMLALELFNKAIASIAGLLVALAPQFTYNSVLLLPDSLSVLPILVATYLFIRASKRPRPVTLIVAGGLFALSCWLRANSMLLAPFMLIAIPKLFERGKRLHFALAFIGGAVLVIAPLTIRNYIVYAHFIPVSLGGGQTLLEGIADYDESGSLGIPNTDMGLMKWEAEVFNRSDYYGMLFSPDGVERDRWRLGRGFGVIRSHPIWFAGVMIRRGANMLRLERVRLINSQPPVSHSLDNNSQPVWSITPADLFNTGRVESKEAKVSLTSDNQLLQIESDQTKYDAQFASAPFNLETHTDYLLKLPVRIEQGRMFVNVLSADDNSQLASAIVDVEDWKARDEQPLSLIEIPFVSAGVTHAQIVFSNGGGKDSITVTQIGQAQIYNLGATSFIWTKIPRTIIRFIQKLFVTAVMLPLALLGLLLLFFARRRGEMLLLLLVPAYFLLFQSMLHTEYRYVLAIHYFLFVIVAVSLYYLYSLIPKASLRILQRSN
ncbi:MAG TPA: glycosyltransferase family 39 protein [Pyrinomonadaceae bacterium]